MIAADERGDIDPSLVAKWLRGWALSRGKPPPEAIAGGWRVAVNEPDQIERYVFARGGEDVRRLTASMAPALTPIKICATPDEAAPLLAPPWAIERTSSMMTKPALSACEARIADGYRLAVTGAGDVVIAFAITGAGDIAAGGRAALIGEVAVFDQISTQEAHRRRALGGAIMRSLENAVVARGAERGMLVATDAGRALYQTLGWDAYAPYTTALAPGAGASPSHLILV